MDECDEEYSDVLVWKKDAERKRKSRQNESNEQTIDRRRRDAKRHRISWTKYRKCESNEEAAERRKINAKRQKKSRAEKYEQQRKLQLFTVRQDLVSFNESTVKCHDIGRMVHKCSECNAYMFKGETHTGSLSKNEAKFSLCCSKGAIKLPPINELPSKLQELLSGNRKCDQNFRQNIRAYNSSLAFASMCLTGQEYQFRNRGPYCYRINGQVYHAISQLQPNGDRSPSFSQIYIYDQQNEIQNRLKSFSHLDPDLLKELQEMIKCTNPYAQTYIHAGDILRENPAAEIKLVLKATRETIDPRRYNVPTGSDVAIIVPTSIEDIDQT